jgi:hypothetical protein
MTRPTHSNPYVRIALWMLLSVSLCTALVVFVVWQVLTEGDWTPAMIERSLGVAIPEHALNVHYEGANRNGEYGITYLDLTFKASPNVMAAFTEHLCGGILYEQYDPFHSIDDRDPIHAQHIIEVFLPDPMYPYSYYSYSLGTPDTVVGNRCIGNNLFELQLYVDRSDSDFHFLHLSYGQANAV